MKEWRRVWMWRKGDNGRYQRFRRDWERVLHHESGLEIILG